MSVVGPRYLERKLAGLCVANASCPRPPKETALLCEHHTALQTRWKRDYLARSHRHRQRRRVLENRMRRQAIANGVCTDCRRRPLYTSWLCRLCVEKRRVKARARRQRHRPCVICRELGHDSRTCKRAPAPRLPLEHYALAQGAA